MPITVDDWKKYWQEGAKNKGDKLVEKFSKAGDIIAAATSENAQKAYEEKMKNDRVLKMRQKKLAMRTTAELVAAMKEYGKDAYNRKVGSPVVAEKAAKGFAPYLPEIYNIKASLPPRSADPAENVDKRVKPIAVGLHKKKLEILGITG